MSFSLPQLLLFIFAYLSALFAVAHLADRGAIPERVTRHPAVYILSLGVFSGALATNGLFSPALYFDSGFLLYYAGVVLLFAMAPVLLLPLLRLCKLYQLSSLADVLTFRFRSQWVGAAVTVSMCLTLLPLLALQIQAVADSVHILAGEARNLLPGTERKDGLALLFCIIITLFSILFGTRHAPAQDRHTGLVTAIAFESLVKLLAMLALMAVAIWQVFDGMDGLQRWLAEHYPAGETSAHRMHGTQARAMLILFFAGAVCMPHMFHMTFAENSRSRDLHTASWALPLYLMLLSLPILPILWAGIALQQELPPEYSSLGMALALQSPMVSAIAFVAGLSASSAVIIVATLALANMCLRHLVLPGRLLQMGGSHSLYRQLRWLQRGLITVLILAGYGFFLLLDGHLSLVQLGMTAFVGTLQFLPGLVATPYWAGANRKGLLCGLAGGLLVWLLLVLLPAASIEPWLYLPWPMTDFDPGVPMWAAATLISLAVNLGLFALVSLLTPNTEDERIGAEICSMDDTQRPVRQAVAQRSTAEFEEQLALALGEQTAHLEVARALRQLQFDTSESRPYALRRLRNRIEANLSGLLGPTVAQSIINRCLPFEDSSQASVEDIALIERKLDRARIQFTGLAADLDNLRRYYREILNNLPVGVCSCASDGELVMWNRSMEQITGIESRDAIGSLLQRLPEPWRSVIDRFLSGEQDTVLKQEVTIPGDESRWVSLHRAATASTTGDRLILVEDITDYEKLERELLHNERLASIGRLAAGVAHEIGNPVTGIACLAQNLEYETEPGEIRHAAQDILKQTDRVSRIVQSLVNFSHTGSSTGDVSLQPCNLADCVDEAIHLLSLDREAPPIEFENRCDRELLVLADSQRLLQVFVNLLGNARDACNDSSRGTPGQDSLASVSAHCNDRGVTVSVEDNGPGIPEALQQQVFEPFFTTKEPGAGTGLGLALVYSILEDLRGSIQLQSPPEGAQRGCRFLLHLRRASYGDTFEG